MTTDTTTTDAPAAAPTTPAADPNPMLWYWGYGTGPENYQGGVATRDEIIEQAIDTCKPGATVTIVRADKQMPNWDVFEGSSVTDTYLDCNEDCVNEDGDLPGFNPTGDQLKELAAALNTVFKLWLDRNNLYHGGYAFARMEQEETIVIPT